MSCLNAILSYDRASQEQRVLLDAYSMAQFVFVYTTRRLCTVVTCNNNYSVLNIGKNTDSVDVDYF